MDVDRDTRIPVSIVTGACGSGKTTLLNHILFDQAARPGGGLRFAVVENGHSGIDETLLETRVSQLRVAGSENTEVIQVLNGCSVRRDIIRALRSMYGKILDKSSAGQFSRLFDAVLYHY